VSEWQLSRDTKGASGYTREDNINDIHRSQNTAPAVPVVALTVVPTHRRVDTRHIHQTPHPVQITPILTTVHARAMSCRMNAPMTDVIGLALARASRGDKRMVWTVDEPEAMVGPNNRTQQRSMDVNRSAMLRSSMHQELSWHLV
jgi:hypothetical protein